MLLSGVRIGKLAVARHAELLACNLLDVREILEVRLFLLERFVLFARGSEPRIRERLVFRDLLEMHLLADERESEIADDENHHEGEHIEAPPPSSAFLSAFHAPSSLSQ